MYENSSLFEFSCYIIVILNCWIFFELLQLLDKIIRVISWMFCCRHKFSKLLMMPSPANISHEPQWNPFLATTQSTSCIHPTLGLWGAFCIRFQDSCVMSMLHFVPSHIPLARLSENLIPRCSTNLYHFIDSLKLTRKKAFLICKNQTAALPSW